MMANILPGIETRKVGNCSQKDRRAILFPAAIGTDVPE